MTSYLYLAYHHNWSGSTAFRRHWLLFVTAERNSNIGTAYDVIDCQHNDEWERRKKDDHDLSTSGTYQDKVVLGRVDNKKLEDLEKVLSETALPSEGEDCQDYVKSGINNLIEEGIVSKVALTYMAMAPSN